MIVTVLYALTSHPLYVLEHPSVACPAGQKPLHLGTWTPHSPEVAGMD